LPNTPAYEQLKAQKYNQKRFPVVAAKQKVPAVDQAKPKPTNKKQIGALLKQSDMIDPKRR
jgi:hypothetical protein